MQFGLTDAFAQCAAHIFTAIPEQARAQRALRRHAQTIACVAKMFARRSNKPDGRLRARQTIRPRRSAALRRIETLYAGDEYAIAMMEAILIGESGKLEKVWTDTFRSVMKHVLVEQKRPPAAPGPGH